MPDKIDKLIEDAKGLRRHLYQQGHRMDGYTVGQMIEAMNAMRAELERAKGDGQQ
jgi:hypothetical protein